MPTKTKIIKKVTKKEIQSKLTIIDIEKNAKRQITLPDFLKTKFNLDLFAKIIRSLRLNAINTSAQTKQRSQVRGGGAKPFRQKGTGHARAGSNRSPLWRGGGIIFGPKNKKAFHLKTNKKEKQLALSMTLADKFNNKLLLVVKNISVKNPKTKQFIDLLIKISKYDADILSKKILFITSKIDKNTYLSVRNIQNINYSNHNKVNLLDLASKNTIILDEETLNFYAETLKVKK